MPKSEIFTWLFSPTRIFLAARSRVVLGTKIIHSTGNLCTCVKQCADVYMKRYDLLSVCVAI